MASPSTSTQDYHANPETPLSSDNAFRRTTMQDIFGSSTESENSMKNEVMIEDEGNSNELWDQIEEDQDENMEDEEDLFGVDKHVCEEMTKNGPQSGLQFESRERLFTSYQAFAKIKGFSIFTRNASNDKYLVLACERARKPNAKKFSKKINCPARLNAVKQSNGYWQISTVHSQHNHDLEPQLSEFMPAHRHLSTNLKVHLEAYDRAGVRTCKTVRMLEALVGGPPNLGASMKDCRNHIEKMRRLRLGDGDAVAIQQMFKSRAAYHDFHDVVSFDTTYLVNQYDMPFGNVVGVNHHHHSILLGCCLLGDERAESFKWFFKNWLDAMGGVQPTAILSDQDESITIALREELPDSIHHKIQKELQAEYLTKCKPITCASEFKWEAQFAKAYTNNIMKLFQTEVKTIWNCNLIPLESDGSVFDSYDITETRTLSMYPSSMELHFIVHGYFMLSYIEGAYPHMSEEYKKFQDIEREFIKCSDFAIDSVEKINFVKDRLKEIYGDLKSWNPASATTLTRPSSSQAIKIDEGVCSSSGCD
ncbi:hypothetical protein SASPL_131029 [Salvia splendens]|uniref:MULE transposase domain-containing protein n=1 Tax=Salvia splendens TaxID=180675 RepID=A0A8X8ZK82_SALSN|nr:hypothetical protein SASPL_131029 [Salvia splendens]